MRIRELIVSDVLALLPYLANGLKCAVIFGVLYLLFYFYCKMRKVECPLKPTRALFIAALITYLDVMAMRTLFSRSPWTYTHYDVTPFSTWGLSKEGNVLFLENILLFIPFGVLMPVCFKQFTSFHVCLGAAIALSFSIEMTQLVFSMGFAQTDDIPTNTYGAIIGWCLHAVARFIYELVYFMITGRHPEHKQEA